MLKNTCIQVFVLTYFFSSLEYMPRSEIAGSYGNSMFNILGTAKLLSKVDAQGYNPIRNV